MGSRDAVTPDDPGERVDQAAEPAASGAPRLRVVRGDATPEEVAALVTALAARAAATRTVHAASGRSGRRPGSGRSRWRDNSLMLRRPLPHGPDAWRAAAR